MKKIIIVLTALIFIFSNQETSSQMKKIMDNFLNLQPIPTLTDDDKLILLISELQNTGTNFKYFNELKEGQVNLKVFDITGREIYTFSEYRTAGYHSIVFNGSSLASGVYFYRIQSGQFIETRRMLLIK